MADRENEQETVSGDYTGANFMPENGSINEEKASTDTAKPTDQRKKFTVVALSPEQEKEIHRVEPTTEQEFLLYDETDMINYIEMRKRTDTIYSNMSASDMSRLGILTPIGDAGSLGGSSVLLASQSYLDISHRVNKFEVRGSSEELGSMGYLDTIMENSEYVDTLRGKLPLAQAARLIAVDKQVTHKELFTKEHVRQVRNECYKKLIVIGISFTLLFSSYFSLRNLQSSSAGNNKSLGLVTFGCLTALMWMGGLFATPIMSAVKPKWALVIASVPFMLYPVANFYPAVYTLVPCALAAGFGVGLLWNCEGVYMINLASKYAFVSRQTLIKVIGQFNALIFAMYQTSHLLGNLLSSLLLGSFTGKANNKTVSHHNATTFLFGVNSSVIIEDPYTEFQNRTCGILFYETNPGILTQTAATEPDNIIHKYILYGILTSFTVLAFLNLTIFLKPLTTPNTVGDQNPLRIGLKFIRLFKEPKILLLVPFMMYPGSSGSVAMADYTKAYITCAYGVGYIGYILMAGACFSIIGAVLSGRIIHKVGRIPLFATGSLLSTASFITMLVWTPTKNRLEVTSFVPVCLWSLGDGIMLTQLNGLLGELFHREMGFALSTLHISYGIGGALGTFTSAFGWMSLAIKTYLIIGHAWVAMIGLVTLELLRKYDKID